MTSKEKSSVKMARMKCFQGNFISGDGVRWGLVIASNQKKASEEAGVSLCDFRKQRRIILSR